MGTAPEPFKNAGRVLMCEWLEVPQFVKLFGG